MTTRHGKKVLLKNSFHGEMFGSASLDAVEMIKKLVYKRTYRCII